MNTRYSKEEMKRLPDDIVIEKLDLSKWEREDKIIPLRNMYLIGIATNYGDEICLGATAGDRVLEKKGSHGLLARDLTEEIAAITTEIEKDEPVREHCAIEDRICFRRK